MRPTVNIYVRRPARLLGATLWAAGWLVASLARFGTAYFCVTVVVAVVQRWAHLRPPVPEEPPERHVSGEEMPSEMVLRAFYRMWLDQQEQDPPEPPTEPQQIQARRTP